MHITKAHLKMSKGKIQEPTRKKLQEIYVMKMRTETIKMRFVDQLYTSKQKIHQIPQSKNKCNCLPDTYRKKQILQNKVFLVHTHTLASHEHKHYIFKYSNSTFRKLFHASQNETQKNHSQEDCMSSRYSKDYLN